MLIHVQKLIFLHVSDLSRHISCLLLLNTFIIRCEDRYCLIFPLIQLLKKALARLFIALRNDANFVCKSSSLLHANSSRDLKEYLINAFDLCRMKSYAPQSNSRKISRYWFNSHISSSCPCLLQPLSGKANKFKIRQVSHKRVACSIHTLRLKTLYSDFATFHITVEWICMFNK